MTATAMKPIDNVLSRLQDVEQTSETQWEARCPCHDDSTASLCIGELGNGHVGIRCQAGCSTQLIVQAIGLEMKDLFAQHERNGSRNGRAKGKGKRGEIVATYDYCDETGKLEFQVVRFDPKDFRQRRPTADGGWDWSVKGCRVLPYRLQDVLAADPSRTVYVAEGEKDVNNLWDNGYVATCNAGGAGKWTDKHSQFLIGRKVVILADNDDAGRDHAKRVRASLTRHTHAKAVELPGLPPKGDVSDWLTANSNVDLEDAVAAATELEPAEGSESEPPGLIPIDKYTLTELRDKFPELNPPVVDGLFRRGEAVNVISASKVGKSWLTYGMAISIITGRKWLDQFSTASGRCLLIDNELDPTVIASRIPRVGEAMGLFLSDFADALDIWPLRGRMRSLDDLATDIFEIEPGKYQAIVMDAKYRFLGEDSENDNAAEAKFYNRVDSFASHTKAAIVLIHHSSKGNQSDKRVTDVGAGAGAQSRAADCHIVLREHEEPGIMVMEAAVRSFAPVEPVALRWKFPLWTVCGADTSLLKGRKPAQEQRQDDRDREGINKIIDSFNEGPATLREIRRRTGLSKDRCERLVDKLFSEHHLKRETITIRGNECCQFQIAETT